MSIDKLQQAIIYNARKNEVEHKQLSEKISDVSNSITEVYEKTITSDNELSERIERFDDKLNEVSQAIDDMGEVYINIDPKDEKDTLNIIKI